MKDMKFNRIFNQVILVALAVLTMTFTACDNDDDDNSGSMMLEAFGPSPALRGSKLTFIGRNLDRVTSVILPANIEITDIEVIDNQRIKVVIPQNAEVGYVKLRFANGLEVTTKTLLTYSEPISISKIAPSPVKAGEKLTIEGDYLNLIQRVIFAEDVEVGSDDFVTWDRKKIVVEVPRAAQTGKIILANNAKIPLELESETELQVVLPSVEKTLDLTNKKPGELIQITVKDIDLVESVLLPSGTPVEFTKEENVLSFTLPEVVIDGVIAMVAPSGVKVAIANIGMAVPSELEAEPVTELKAGDVITIKGLNMNLTTTVTFPGVEAAVKPQSISATSIKVEMPEAAISGNLVLNTASGNTSAPIAISTLKPEVLAYNPSPVAAGSELTLVGKHLDLVTSVTFGGGKQGTILSQAATELGVKVPADAETGEVILKMKNGETVTSASLDITKPVFCYIPELPADDVEIKAGEILSIAVQNADKLTNVQVNGSNTQYILQKSTLYILIPNNASGKTTVTLLSSNGSIDYTLDVIGSGTIETIIMDQVHNLGNWASEADGGAFRLYKEAFNDVKAGSILKFYFAVTGSGQLQINDANWGKWESEIEFNDLTQTSYEMELTQAFLTRILSTNDGWSTTAIVIQGQHLIISKVSIITKGGTAVQTIWTGSQVMPENWGGSLQLTDVSLFAKAKVGQKIVVKTADVLAGAQGSFKDGNWIAIADGTEYFDITGDFELTITADILTKLHAGGMIISGKNYTAVSVSIK